MRAAYLVAVAVLIVAPAASRAAWPIRGPINRGSHYNLLPSRSALVKTGGFAGVNSRYVIQGDFDFDVLAMFPMMAEGFEGEVGIEWGARFENANVYAPLGPMLPAFVDVDHLLNLELLRGELLPLGAPFNVYRFRGVINDGIAASPLESSTIELYAAQAGPWMYLWGETTPPPHSADFFSYEIKAVARTGRWADWNEDGVVNAADYTVMRDQQSNPLANAVDWATAYGDWKSQFGEKAPDVDAMIASFSAAMAASTALAIPEATTIWLAAIATTTMTIRRRLT